MTFKIIMSLFKRKPFFRVFDQVRHTQKKTKKKEDTNLSLLDETLNRGPMIIFQEKLLTRTNCDKAGDYAVPNVLSPRDLVFRPD